MRGLWIYWLQMTQTIIPMSTTGIMMVGTGPSSESVNENTHTQKSIMLDKTDDKQTPTTRWSIHSSSTTRYHNNHLLFLTPYSSHHQPLSVYLVRPTTRGLLLRCHLNGGMYRKALRIQTAPHITSILPVDCIVQLSRNSSRQLLCNIRKPRI